MKKATIQLETLTCPSCMSKIMGAVKTLNGIDKDSLNVLFNASKVKFDYDDEVLDVTEVEDAIKKLGYKVLKTTIK